MFRLNDVRPGLRAGMIIRPLSNVANSILAVDNGQRTKHALAIADVNL